jgi:hypothetical protein
VSQWLPNRQTTMLLRVVVRELESWLLADHENMATFLSVSKELVPGNSEQLPDPKEEVVRLARRSRSKAIRESLVPRAGSTARVGPLYEAEMIRFIRNHWDISHAASYAPSLARCVQRLRELP